MTRISTRAANSILLNQSLRTQQRLFDAQVSIASEKKTQVYQGLAIDSRRLVNIENSRNLLQRFNLNNDQMDVKLEIMNTSVEAIRQTFSEFRDYAGSFATTSQNGEVEVRDIQAQAFEALKAIEGYLNIDVDGQYLFSGNSVLTEPIDFGLTTIEDFQAKYNGDTVSVPTTRDASLENFSYSQDVINKDALSVDAANFLQFRQDSADELTRLIYSLTAAAATGSVSTITSETLAVATTNNVETIESVAVNGNNVSGSSTLMHADVFAATAGDAFTFEVLLGGTSLNSDIFTISATTTVDDLLASITALDDSITATFNTTSGEVEIEASGGLEFKLTNTSAAALEADVTAAAASVAEVETITLAGLYGIGDTIDININGLGVDTYTVTAGDIGANANATQTNVATAVAAMVDAGNGTAVIGAASTGNVITITADTVNTAFTTVVSPTQAATNDPQTEFQFGSGAGIMVSGVAQTFDTTQSDTDLIATAFGATLGDTLTFSVTGGEGTTNAVAFTIGTQSVSELITHINDIDTDITASFNTVTKQIDITSGSGGSILTFAESGSALSDFAFNDGAAAVTAGAVTYATTQTDSDTLIAAFGLDSADVLSVELGNGASIDFTVANQTIAQLTSAISALDSTITASFNTTSKQIDITSDTADTAVTFTNTVGDPLTEFQFNDGGSVASGETSTFTVDGLTKSSTITATSALFSNVSVGSTINVTNSATNNGTYQVTAVSDDGRTVTVNTRMLTDELNATPTITYPDPDNPNSTLSMTAADFYDLTFTRSNDTIHSAQAGALAALAVGTSFTVTGTANNDGTYTVESNDDSNVVIKSLKLNDEGLTTGNTYFETYSNTDVNFDSATKTIQIRQASTTIGVPNSFNGLTVGQAITLAGTAVNSNTLTVASISADGSSITVNETINDETNTTGVDINSSGNSNFTYTSDSRMVFDATADTIQLQDNSGNPVLKAFSGLTAGMKIVADNMPTATNNRTYTIASVSDDGSTITIAEDIETTETDTDGARLRVFAASGAVSANSYYNGDELTSKHRVSTTQNFTNNIDGIDPAFEKGIRALFLIAQGEYATAGGLDQNQERINEALYLINTSLQRAVTGEAPFGDELAGNIEQVEIDIGYHRVLIDTTKTINTDLMAFYDATTSDIENADLQTLVTKLLDDQNALEASYQAYARITQLSLTNYL